MEPTMKQAKRWIVIADGEHARFVALTEHERGYETVRAIDSATAHLKTAALGSERPGRATERATGLRHALEPRSDRHRQAKAAFGALVADTINQAVARGECISFILVAPTHQLAAIRKRLDPAAAARLSDSLAKDLTKVPDGELASHLLPLQQSGRKRAAG
jgi:protein required for attachment to host cells